MTRATDRPLRVGVLGCGTIAYWSHLREVGRLPGAQLVVAADPDPTARARAARLCGVPVLARSEDVLADANVDAVVIATPTATHAALAVAAAEAGKHVYIEKPVATTAEEASAVAAAGRAASVIVAVGFNYRHHPAHEHARMLLRKGAIGRVLAVQTAFSEPAQAGVLPEWKRQRGTGGGVLLDLASHHVDLLRHMLDDEVTCVDARIGSRHTEHDTASVRLATRGGIDVQGVFALLGGPLDRLEFVGERGSLRVDRQRASVVVSVKRRYGYGVRNAWLLPCLPLLLMSLRRLVQPSHDPSRRLALEAFVARVRGAEVALATVEDGARCLAVILAAEASARLGTPVTLPPSEP